MLLAVCYLLGFHLAGELLARSLGLPVPGNVLGMLLLFIFLLLRRGVPKVLDDFVPKLLSPMVLYFMPSAVGVITLGPLLAREGLGIAAVMILSTLVPLWLLAFVLDRWLQKRGIGRATALPEKRDV